MKKKYLALVSGVIILGAICIFMFLGDNSSNKDDPETTTAYRSMKVLEYDGTATIEREDIGEISIYEGMQVISGDKITVDEDSYVRLVLDDDKYVYVEENTVLSIEASGSANDSQTEIVVETGAIINELTVPLSDASTYDVTTPNASMSVRGTVYGIEVYEVDGIVLTDLNVFEGTVASVLIMTDGSREQEVVVDKGYAVTVESDSLTYCEYVLELIDDQPLKEIDLSTVSDGILSLLEKVVESTEKDVQFNTTEVQEEVSRRNEAVIKESYNLTLVNRGVESIYTYDENEQIAISEPTRTGYTFNGWYNENYTEEIELDTMPDNDVTAYALWEVRSYEVTFDGVVQEVDYNNLASEPEEPTKDGYTFVGWYSGDEEYNFATPVVGDIVLESTWIQTENTLTTSIDEITTNYMYYSYQDIDIESPTKEGYTFVGWYNKDFSEEIELDIMPDNDLTIYALWQINTYEVTFDEVVQEVDYNDLASEPEEPTKDGYTFVGWYLGDEEYNFATPVVGDIVLESTWIQTENTLTTSIDEITTNYMYYSYQDIDIESPTKEGYTFVGWYNKDFSEEIELDIMPDNDLTIYALWQINTYEVTFDGVVQKVDYNNLASELEEPTKDGYTFIGWYLGDEEYNFATPVVGDIVLESTWIQTENTLTTSIDEITTNYTYYSYEEIDIESPTKEGYTFVGWYNEDFNEEIELDIMPDNDLTIYALWQINTYDVTFDEVVNKVDYNDLALEPEKPAKDGYTFIGWYLGDEEYNFATPVVRDIVLESTWIQTENTLTTSIDGITTNYTYYSYEEIDIESPSKEGYTFVGWYNEDFNEEIELDIMPDNDLTIYALWQINTYEVTFDEVVQKVDYNDLASEPEKPTEDGFTFIGWYLGDEEYNFATPVVGDIVLESMWDANENTLTTNVDGLELTYTYDTYDQLNLTDPVKDGYDFVGWYDDNNDKWTNDNIMPTDDLKLYAKFTEATYIVTLYDEESKIGQTEVVYGTSIIDTIMADENIETDKTDYLFIGWYEESTCENSVLVTQTMGSSDMNLYGKWMLYYELTYTIDGEENTMKLLEGQDASLGMLEDTIIDGYLSRQVGWSVVGSNTNTVMTSIVMPAYDCTAEPVWERLYTITFYDSNENEITDYTGEYVYLAGDSLVPMPVLTNENYGTFIGWYDDTEVETRWKIGSIMPSYDLKVYAKWDKNYYPVNMISNGITIDIAYMEYQAVVINELAEYSMTKTGYTFDGWYLDAEFETELSSDDLKEDETLNVYAKWIENDYVIHYQDDGDTIVDSTIYKYTDTVELESGLFNNGYFIWKWKDSVSGETYSLGEEVVISELADGAVEQDDGTWLITMEPTFSIHFW